MSFIRSESDGSDGLNEELTELLQLCEKENSDSIVDMIALYRKLALLAEIDCDQVSREE